MASEKSSKMASDKPPATASEVLPSAIVLQAEAAIHGHFDDDEDEGNKLLPTYSYLSSEAGSEEGLSRHVSHDQNLLAQDGTSEPPPAYGDAHDQIELDRDGLKTQAKVTDDGRLNINILQRNRKLSDLILPTLRSQISLVAEEEAHPLPPGYIPPALGGLPGQTPPPHLNVVIHVVGSRGDVQPFVALGKTLKATYGHRVRLATHPTFQTFVEENGLEFFSIGGDPSELMAFMVKNPGLMPGIDSLKSGDVGKRRKGMEEIVLGCWRSCIEAGDGLAPPTSRTSMESLLGFQDGINMDAHDRPFIAEAIIANPPSFAHIHIAEKLGIPLHMMFTMPWSPTQSFPHPLANIQSSNADVNMSNFLSYAMVEMMTWQGLGDVINRFRERALGLDPISLIWAPGMLDRLRVPYTYCWSPALIPKPKDWSQHISISGFYFLSLASSYTPAPDLAAFLNDGPPPVYIGFGSIVVDDPNAMTKLIFDAIKAVGCRALVSKGWGGLGADAVGIPDGVFMLGNVPHDWLFKHVSCVVHHGGAGTTAAGISLGKPTVVVPFFGDQPFWGAMVARAGAGPHPVPYKQLTSEKLAESIKQALLPETLAKAQELGSRIKEEKGTEMGAKSFHDQLNVESLRCSVIPEKAAVWRVKRTQTRLSALAASILASEGLIDFADLKLYRPKEYDTDDGPWDPISGGASALLGTIASMTMGVADFPMEIFKSVKGKKGSVDLKDGDSSRRDSKSGSATPSSLSLSTRATSSEVNRSSEDTFDRKTSLSNEVEFMQSSVTDQIRSPTGTAPWSKSSLDGVARSGTETTVGSMPSRQGSSMKQALKGALTNCPLSRSNSRDRGSDKYSRSNSKDRVGSRGSSPMRYQKEFEPNQLSIENVAGAAKGISRIVGAGIKSPMDFTLGLARGFHNAPKLYGDDTVRPQEKVDGIHSGLKAAGKEFGYGFYDGITGLVTQPLRGAEKEGAAGFFKGVGKGLGGLILKPGAAIWGIPGYAFMGVHREVRKMFGASVVSYVISARTAQGYEEAMAASPEDRKQIIAQWVAHKEEYQSEKQKLQDQGGPEGQESGRLTRKGWKEQRRLPFEERRRLHNERKDTRAKERDKSHGTEGSKSCPFCRRAFPHKHNPRPIKEYQTPQLAEANLVTHTLSNAELENAIQAAVKSTSNGNSVEDQTIERAIRASIRELQSSDTAPLDDEQALDAAIKASVAEVLKDRHQDDAEHQALLDKAIRLSLQEQHVANSKSESLDMDDDEKLKLAIQASLDHAEIESQRGRSEEEVVLNYVKKQSLAEEEHRRALLEKSKKA